jgi:hypothetical protein
MGKNFAIILRPEIILHEDGSVSVFLGHPKNFGPSDDGVFYDEDTLRKEYPQYVGVAEMMMSNIYDGKKSDLMMHIARELKMRGQ